MFKQTIINILVITMLASCTSQENKIATSDLTQSAVIPKPASVVSTGKEFKLNNKTGVSINSQKLGNIAKYLNQLTGLKLPPKTSTQPLESHINLILDEDKVSLENEAYELVIHANNITLSASTSAGIFRGIQTLRQLLPTSLENKKIQDEEVMIPTGTILDSPEYEYRGAMLDVSRHFFGVEDVKRYIDLIAFYKLNYLHLHLSDDQGWRIEIKSWPKLTKIGGSTEVGGGEGGFYTQQEYKEIIKYAQKRYITIIPEIDMPGHTNAALASYPILNCDDKSPELYTGIEVGFSSLCMDKKITDEFIDDVIGELAAMTPGPYIHIGGDESNSTAIEDYIPFINRVQRIVKKHGKAPIGWADIASADLEPGTVVQFWAKPENALKGQAKGAKVLMSPATKTYLDMQYDSTSRLGLHWAAYIEVDSAYTWAPTSLVPGIKKENILGVESPLWSETLENIDDIEYMAFPRLIGHAEIGWTRASQRSWDDYKARLAVHGKRLKNMSVNFYPSDKVDWPVK